MDKNIVQDVLRGNTEKFSLLIDKYYNELFVFVHNQVNDIHETEDILQEIFMKLFAKLNKYNATKSSFRTWMYRVSYHHCMDYHRKKKLYTVSDYNLNLLSSNEDVIANIMKQEDMGYVFTVMSKVLSKKQYSIMMLQFFSPLSTKEIGETLGVSQKTVQNYIGISIKKIRNEMEVRKNGTIQESTYVE